jgi:hypothetical protein
MLMSAFVCTVLARACEAYSVLTHEALVDVLWDTKLKQALLARYLDAPLEQLKEA